MGQEEYRELTSFLDRFIRRLKTLQGLDGLCRLGICLLLLFSLGIGIQQIKALFPYAPLLYSLLTAGILSLFVGWTLFQWLRRVSRERAALHIEERYPHLKNNLINSLQLYPQIADRKESRGISTSMVLALLRATRRQLLGLRNEELIPTGSIKAHARLFGLLFVPILAIVLFNPSSVSETFSLLVRPLKDLPPSETVIEVTPKGSRIARGSPVTIEAATSGAIPKSMDLVIRPVDGSVQEKVPMRELGGGRFSATLPEVQKSLEYRAAAGLFSSRAYTIEAIDPPEIGGLKIVLYPPHYTGLPAQTFQRGNIEGLKGSAIRLEALTTKEVVKARMLLDEGREAPLKIDGKKLQGQLVLFQSQKYRILIEDHFGFRNGPIPYEIRVRPDGFPTVELLTPAEDLEVNGDEILPLEFTARDDFGIREIALAVRVGDRQERLPIERDGNKRFIARERFNWDLGKLGLRAGDEAIYHLEVLDNDTISGPKIGSSRPLRLRLKNLREEHKQVAEMIRDLSNRMVDLLADHLEKAPSDPKEPPRSGEPSHRDFEQKLAQTIKQVEEAMRRSEKDRLTDFATWSDLEALRRNLEFTKEDLLKKSEQAVSPEEREGLHDQIATELERMSMLSEEIGKRLRAQELASTAQDLMRSQERLLDALEGLKSGDQNLDAVLRELSEMAKLLNSLQQSLSQFASRLPDEFVNSEALRGLSFNEMLSRLDELRKRLMQGDIEGAMQLARELFNQMASMLAALRNAHRSALSSTMGRMQGEMMRSASELEQIAREQQEILVETETINKEGLKQREAALKRKLEQFEPRAEQELARLAELFPDEEHEHESKAGEAHRTAERHLEDRLDEAALNSLFKEMISRLLGKDFSGFAEIMAMAEKELGKERSSEQEGKARTAQSVLKGMRKGLEELLLEPSQDANDEERRTLRELSHRQGILKDRTLDLHEKLNSLFQLFPALDPKITKNIQEAGSSMGKAQGRLRDIDAKGAIPPEREALDRLSQSQQEMQSAMQRLAQRGQLGNMPVPYLFRRGRFLPYGSLVPLPGMPEFPQFDVEGGFTGLDTERFRLPGKEDYKVPRGYREEILDALRQDVPPQFKDQIESYFKNLSE